MATDDAPGYQAQSTAAYQFVIGWIVLLVLLNLANRTRIGHVILYYSLTLMIVLILLTQAPKIGTFLGAIATESPS